MGKELELPVGSEQPAAPARNVTKRLPLLFILLGFAAYRLTCSMNGDGVAPNPGISWTPCGDNIDCGHLSVPLDYHNETGGTANLAVARYRATNKTERLGTIFTNPGGPGGSGVSYVYRAGPRISGIVSWDPRGVNGTTPRVECFSSQTAQDAYFGHTQQEMGLEGRNLSDPIDFTVFTANVRRADASNAALAKLCAETSGETLKHVGTATVVRDMEYLSRVIEGDDAPINFWGFSYGTIVGSYFVNMFPQRVGRVVIDGVVNPDLWANTYSNEWYKYDLVDTDSVFDNFVKACQAAGPARCALASDKSTSRSITSKVDQFITDLYDYPLPVTKAKRPGILTSGMVKAQLFSAMYSPRDWHTFAQKLAEAMAGNGTALMDAAQGELELDTSIQPKTSQAITAVTCVDTPAYPENVDKAIFLEQYIDETALTYKVTSKRFATVDLDLCHHWTPRETERFTGPFNHSLSNTILIVGNTADPITPGVNAKAVNEMLKDDSRLIIQDGSGHCSSAMASLCTGKAIREYFLEGQLPPNGIVCPTNEVLFPPQNISDAMAWVAGDIYSEEDLRGSGNTICGLLYPTIDLTDLSQIRGVDSQNTYAYRACLIYEDSQS
ncbi:Alpha/Beta hydrolase protein [Hysterangium stoloniferum]|nr:Alpha/Beta hydrolase protein [Hysterangium stoloniferum]